MSSAPARIRRSPAVSTRRMSLPWRAPAGRFARWRPPTTSPIRPSSRTRWSCAATLAVLARPGAPERQAEVAGTEELVRSLGLEVARIEPPGTLDGGDVLQVGSTVYAGRGGRTNAEGIRQLRRLLATRGRTVVPVPLRGVLHLKSAVTALPDGTLVGRRRRRASSAARSRRCGMVPEEAGSHVVPLGDGTLLMAASAPRSAELFDDLGFDVLTRRHQRVREARGLRDLPLGARGLALEPALERLELLAQLARQRVAELRVVLVHLRQLRLPLLGVDLEQLLERVVAQVEARSGRARPSSARARSASRRPRPRRRSGGRSRRARGCSRRSPATGSCRRRPCGTS